jgi:hypothetical protein
MPRKDNSKNPLQIKLRARSLPKRVTVETYHRRLLQFIHEGKPLPAGWDVEISWRNPATKHGATKRWRSDDFESAILESRDGFVKAVAVALSRRLRRMEE